MQAQAEELKLMENKIQSMTKQREAENLKFAEEKATIGRQAASREKRIKQLELDLKNTTNELAALKQRYELDCGNTPIVQNLVSQAWYYEYRNQISLLTMQKDQLLRENEQLRQNK